MVAVFVSTTFQIHCIVLNADVARTSTLVCVFVWIAVAATSSNAAVAAMAVAAAIAAAMAAATAAVARCSSGFNTFESSWPCRKFRPLVAKIKSVVVVAADHCC